MTDKELPVTICPLKEDKEFKLSDKRKEFYKLCCEKSQDKITLLAYIFGKIEEQDKEFIKLLKEEIFDEFMKSDTKSKHRHFYEVLMEKHLNRIDKLAGDLK